jgi:hypothetical protein
VSEIPCHQGNTRFFKNGGKTARGSSMLTFQGNSLPRSILRGEARRRSGAATTNYDLASISRRLELSAQLFAHADRARERDYRKKRRNGASWHFETCHRRAATSVHLGKGEVIGESAN